MNPNSTAIVPNRAVTKEHESLADKFASRVVSSLSMAYKVKKYAVESDWMDREILEVEIEGGALLSISLVVKK